MHVFVYRSLLEIRTYIDFDRFSGQTRVPYNRTFRNRDVLYICGWFHPGHAGYVYSIYSEDGGGSHRGHRECNVSVSQGED